MAYLIIGLGNPGKRYRANPTQYRVYGSGKTCRSVGNRFETEEFQCFMGQRDNCREQCSSGQPQTFMNLSGTAVRQLQSFFKTDISNLIVIHDDLDLPFGAIRLKAGGGTAGHKGLASIESNLGTSDFMRVRLGIGKPVDKSRIEGYVLEPFRKEEQIVLPELHSMGSRCER